MVKCTVLRKYFIIVTSVCVYKAAAKLIDKRCSCHYRRADKECIVQYGKLNGHLLFLCNVINEAE